MRLKRLRHVVIVGAGDVASRLVRRRQQAWKAVCAKMPHDGQRPPGRRAALRWLSLARSRQSADTQRLAGMLPVMGDLDVAASLARIRRLARSAAAVLVLAPPPAQGLDDPRLRRMLAVPPARCRRRRAGGRATRSTRRARPLACVYVSTTGVYGDCLGERIDETRRLQPTTDRARRRVAAEAHWRQSARRGRLLGRTTGGSRAVILRAPGIYALDRLPLDRLRARTPVLRREEDVFTNHIHADDLADAVWRSMFHGRPLRVYNVVDEAEWTMAEYFDRVADAFGLPRPPRMSRHELVHHISPMLLSFMNESRRIGNRRLLRELGVRLRYPTPAALLSATTHAATTSPAPVQGALW